jgi:hypothetical protein
MKHKIFKVEYERHIRVETLVKAHTQAEATQKFRDHDFMITPKEIECVEEFLSKIEEVKQ